MCIKQLSKLIKLPIYLLYMYNKKQVLSRRSVREKGVEGRQLLLSFFSADGRATAVEAVMHSLFSDSFTFLRREKPVVLDRFISHTIWVLSGPSLRTRFGCFSQVATAESDYLAWGSHAWGAPLAPCGATAAGD